ncbi:MAG: hypothetical protein AAF798_05075 [Bacteroidota bacterium]
MNLPSSKWVIGIVLLFAVACSWIHNKIGSQETNVLTWDVYGYYLYLPAIFIYGDTEAYTFTEQHFENYQISTNRYQLNPKSEGLFAPIYTIGMAILWLPFFLIAHALAAMTSTWPADGLSFPYQLAIVIASWAYALLGWWYLRKILLIFCSEWVTSLTVVVIFLGTNYFHYLCFESGMPHSFLFALYAVVLYQTYQFYQQPSWGRVIAVGVPMALLCLARPSEGIVLLLFFGYGLYNTATIRARLPFWRKHFTKLVLLGAVGVLTISPQLFYWKLNLGMWVYNGYEGHHFDFWKPHLLEGLFSYRKGWLLYTPIMLLIVPGFIWLYSKMRTWFWPVLGFTLLNLYIVYSWHIWWYASTFGSRAVIQSYAVLALPIASFFGSTFVQKSRLLQWIVGSFILGCIALNHFQDWQYRQRILPFDETTKTYYWKIFGATSLPSADLRKYLDVDEAMPPSFTKVIAQQKAIVQADSSQQAIGIQQGRMAERLDKSHEFSQTINWYLNEAEGEQYSNNWLQVDASVFAESSNFIKWQTAYFVTEIQRNGESTKWIGVRFQRYIKPQQWEALRYETQLPALQANDLIKVYLWNQGPDTIYQEGIQARILSQ